MKIKIMVALTGAGAAVLIFAAAFIFAQLHIVNSMADRPAAEELGEPAVQAFVELTTEMPPVYNVASGGDEIYVFASDGTVVMTMSLPLDLPADERATLKNGITIFGYEELLLFLEDYSEGQ